MIAILITVSILLTGCGNFEAAPGTNDLVNPPSSAEPPITVPGAVSSGSWIGLTGLSSQGLQSALAGTWATSCISSMVLTEKFSAGFVNQTTFSYGTADCSGSPTSSRSITFSTVLGGSNGVVADGYDINIGIGSTSAPYQIVKVNSSGTMMALGFATAAQDGSAHDRRPISWFPISFIKQ